MDESKNTNSDAAKQNSAASAGSESPEEGEAAKAAAEDAVIDDSHGDGRKTP